MLFTELFNTISTTIANFVQSHPKFLYTVVFLLSFGESLVFLSLVLPATVVLLALNCFIIKIGASLKLIWLTATLGAFLGDWFSYWLGYHYHVRIEHWWPLSKWPKILDSGHTFFQRYGAIGVFIGRFFGPLRASVPIAAGVCQMPFWPFQIANSTSAALWSLLMLLPSCLIVSHWAWTQQMPWIGKLLAWLKQILGE